MADDITFSIEGLTIRGFYEHMYHWVPFIGEKLVCELTEDGPISAFREGQIVGNVPKEVSRLFRKWLEAGGKLEAVVVTIVPNVHKTKGDELPVIYLFTGKDTPLMINMKNSIETDMEKKAKGKMSLKFHPGDITSNIDRELIDNLILSFEDQTNQLDFSVLGKSLRGFGAYKERWVPQIGSRHECFINPQKALVAKLGDGEVRGPTVPTDTQKIWKRFLKAGGKITAVITGRPKWHRSKGEEVPVTYVFTGDRTPVLTNLRRSIVADIEKKKKKNKSLCIVAADATCKTGAMDHASTSQVSQADSDTEASYEEQEEANGMLEGTKASDPSPASLRSSRKRGLDKSGDTADTEPIKKKKKKHSSKSGKKSAKKKDYKISLTDKDFSKIAQMIVSNWQLLGYELGLEQIDISRVEINNNNNCVANKICRMLMRWREIMPDNATLGHLIKAVNECSEVEIGRQRYKNFIKEKRSAQKSE